MLDKASVLDIVAEDENSRAIDIEIQIANHLNFVERTLYYWSRLYSSQLTQNESYKKLKPVISIILTDFQVFNDVDLLHTSFSIRSNDEKRYLLTDHFEMHFLRVPEKIDDQTPMAVSQPLKSWLTFFGYPKKVTEAQMLEAANNDTGVQVAEGAYGDFVKTPEYCLLLALREKCQRDRVSQLETQLEEVREEGREEGIREGEARGKAETLIKIVTSQFGLLPDDLRTKISQLTDVAELNRLIDIAFDVTSLEQFVENL